VVGAGWWTTPCHDCVAPQYALNTRRPGGPQSQSGYSEEKKNLLPLPGIEPETIQPIAWSLH